MSSVRSDSGAPSTYTDFDARVRTEDDNNAAAAVCSHFHRDTDRHSAAERLALVAVPRLSASRLSSAMFRTKLTAAEAKLPEECQQPAVRARRRSFRIRMHVAVLLVLYTGWCGFQIGASLYNAHRESKDAFARKHLFLRQFEFSSILSVISSFAVHVLLSEVIDDSVLSRTRSRHRLPTWRCRCRLPGLVILNSRQEATTDCDTVGATPANPGFSFFHHSNFSGLVVLLQRRACRMAPEALSDCRSIPNGMPYMLHLPTTFGLMTTCAVCTCQT